MATTSGYFLQTTFGVTGNFEMVLPSPQGGLVHTWRNNDSAGFPWMAPTFFASGYLDGVSLIQRSDKGQTPGDLEVVSRVGDRLAHLVRRASRWKEPMFFTSGVSGRPSFIQSSLGQKGNYEVVAPLAAGGLAPYSRDNDDPAEPWSAPVVFAASLGRVDSVALIQSNFGDPGNLELIARSSNALWHFWRDSGAWHGPNPVPLAGFPAGAIPIGIHSFMQSRYGTMGNFELVTPLSTGGMAHLTRNNDAPDLAWSPALRLATGRITESSVIHSSFGNLELIARTGKRYDHLFYQCGADAWTGPTATAYEAPETNAALGDWQVPYSSAVMGIHAAQLHSGQVLLFSYVDMMDVGPGNSCLVDPSSGDSKLLPTVERNPFCGGQSFLSDGTLLVAGGADQGINSLHTFSTDAASGQWRELSDMQDGRWYPTCTTLPDGRVFIISGTKTGGGQPEAEVNDTYEIYSPQTGLGGRVSAPYLNEVAPVSIYPFVFVLPSRKLFIHAWNKTCFLDFDSGQFEDRRVLTLREEPRNYPVQGTAVLLPLLPTTTPPYRARVMLIGGGGVPPAVDMPATATCEILDLGSEPLTWRAAAPLTRPRVMCDAVLLPDGTVLVMNGSSTGWAHNADQPVYEAELYNPVENRWTTLSSERVPRLYHSAAILLADGRVMTSGNDRDYNLAPFNQAELRLELFSPPYLLRGPRPVIASAPAQITYGSDFTVRTPGAASIASAALLRPGAVTHSFNMDHRYVGLTIRGRSSQSLTLQATPNGNAAPPRYPMLFLVNSAGVPSVGHFLRLL